MQEVIIEYWYLLVISACMGGVLVQAINSFTTLSSATQLDCVKEWLLYAVIQAEYNFESGSGSIKLRYVYDLFVARFPLLVSLVSFEKFSVLVDGALEKAKVYLQEQEANYE